MIEKARKGQRGHSVLFKLFTIASSWLVQKLKSSKVQMFKLSTSVLGVTRGQSFGIAVSLAVSLAEPC